METYIRGFVFEDETRRAVRGIRVALGTVEMIGFRQIQSTATNARGRFKFRIEEVQGRTYEVRLFRGDEPVEVTSGNGRWASGRAPKDIELYTPPARRRTRASDVPGGPPFAGSARGRVRHADGTPIKAATPGNSIVIRAVNAVDGSTRGVATTDVKGGYVVDTGGEEGALTLIEVWELDLDGGDVGDLDWDDPDPAWEKVGESKVHVNDEGGAALHDHLDIDVTHDSYRGDSEFAELHDSLDDFVTDSGGLDDLDANQALLGASLAPHPREQVVHYLVARKIASQLTAMDPDEELVIDPEPVYALLRAGMPENAGRIASSSDVAILGALTRAADANVISVAAGAAAADTLADLRKASRLHSLAPDTKGSLGNLLDTGIESSGWDMAKRVKLLETQAQHPGPRLWAALPTIMDGIDRVFSDDDIDDLFRTVHLGVITANHAPAVASLNDLHPAIAPKDLAGFTSSDWDDVLDNIAPGQAKWPEGVVGEDPVAQRANYVELLQRQVESSMPSEVVKARITAQGTSTDEITFFASNPTFNFETGVVSEAVAAPLRAQLKKRQRLYRVSPSFNRFEAMDALHSDFDSAGAIAKYGRTRFVSDYASAVGGAEPAGAIFDRARAVHAMAVTATAQNQASLQGPVTTVIPAAPSTSETIPGYASLFGASSYCGCSDCLSVLSPAAYYVDLLKWLKDGPGLGDGDPDDLRARRPELVTIELSCANTYTELPYIDLVNEVLEDSIAPPEIYPKATTGTAEERSVTPEHVNEAAYEALQEAFYPFALPFDRAASQMRAFLALFGWTRSDLMAVATQIPVGIQAEEVGVSDVGWDLLIGASDAEDYELWGYSAAVVGEDDTPWNEDLCSVPTFLARAQLTYEELLDLQASRIANPWNDDDDRPMFDLYRPDPCDVATWSLTTPVEGDDPYGPTVEDFGKWVRYLRLRRALGLSMLELDKCMRTFAVDLDTTSPTQAELAAYFAMIHVVRRNYGGDLAEWLSWWHSGAPTSGRIDTLLDRDTAASPVASLYDRTFLDPAMPASSRTIFALNAARSELAVLDTPPDPLPFLADYPSEIASAVGVAGSDFQLIIDDIGVDPALDLRGLTEVYRRASLARKVGMEVRDALRLRQIVEPEAFDLPKTVTFLRAAARIKASPFSVDEIMYIIGHDEAAGSRVAPDVEAIRGVLGPLRADLRQLRPARVAAARARLAGALGIDATSIDVLRSRSFDALAPTADIIDVFVDDDFVGTSENPAPSDPYADLTGPDSGDSAIAAAFVALELLMKVARIIRGLAIRAPELTACAGHSSDIGVLDFWSIPMAAPGSPAYAEFLDTCDLFASRGRLPGETPTFASILALLPGSDDDDLARAVARRTQWNSSDIATWATRFGEDVAGSLRVDIGAWLRLLAAMDATRALGVPATRLIAWADSAPDTGRSNEVVAAARARFATQEDWIVAARPVRDELRKQQRDALVSHLLATGDSPLPLGRVDDLYKRYLIDPQMDPCALTSRIGQALSTVQLFIDRGFAGIEPRAEFTSADAVAWTWMKSYSVWGAARKVFLYPENWIEPDLRDDTTTLFDDLGRALQQAEPTTDMMEAAIEGYLGKLHEVSNLMVVGQFHQVRGGEEPADILHIVARTRSQPFAFFYRQKNNGLWTPWEPLEGPDGDHVIPVVHDRRLFIFWPTFATKHENQPDAIATPYHEITLSWVERRHDKWSTKRTNVDEVLVHNSDDGTLGRRGAYNFRPNMTPDNGMELVCLYFPDGADEIVSVDVSWTPFTYEIETRSVPTTEVAFVGVFVIDECTLSIDAYRSSPTDLVTTNTNFPDGSMPWFNGFRQLNPGGLDVVSSGDGSTEHLLTTTPTAMTTVVSLQDGPFTGQDAFFLVDRRRSFFVDPRLPSETDLQFQASGEMLSINGMTQAVPKSKFATLDPADTPVAESTVTRHQAAFESSRGTASSQAQRTQRSTNRASGSLSPVETRPAAAGNYEFTTFYHPYVCEFLEAVHRYGVFGLLDPEEGGLFDALVRQQAENESFDFSDLYGPTSAIAVPPVEDIDFTLGGPYAIYNWELFFHAPLLIATKLSANLRFEEAHRWFHTIFDPGCRTERFTEANGYPATARYWKTKPFVDPMSSVEQWEAFLGNPTSDAAAAYEAEVAAWRQDPFNPHLLARLRPSAYPRATLMKYLDHLIAWGDDLFRQNTIETINLATQRYMLAAELLGEKPLRLPDPTAPVVKSFHDLNVEGALDGFGDAASEVENLVFTPLGSAAYDEVAPMPALNATDYFCVPPNDRLLAYWDTVADRMFKIRHCMNIDGQVQQLALFESLLGADQMAQLLSNNADLSDVTGPSAGTPNYRFSTMSQKAMALAGSVRGLGAALLAALEKGDSETLSKLRSSHETALLAKVRLVKEQQLGDAQVALEATLATKATTAQRREYYESLIDKGLIAEEETYQTLLATANFVQVNAQAGHALAGLLHIAPQVSGPIPSIEWGGDEAGSAMASGADALGALASIVMNAAQRVSRTGLNKRRVQEWQQQLDAADRELAALDKQVAGAELRVTIAEQELANHDLQVTQSREVDDFLAIKKFTNVELYGWMSTQLATLYYRSYQLAFDLAKQAEACFHREMGGEDVYIRYAQWDGQRKGLLAGEQLQADLELMDAAYLQADVREFELVKHVSLSQLDPIALEALKSSAGACFLEIPEAVFDADCPNHIFRRLQSVAVSLACVGGPLGTVNVQLTLLRHGIRKVAGTGALDEDDDFTTSTESVVTSVAMNDFGVFNADARDPRYLPFERRGAISRWKLEFTATTWKQFDWQTLTDVTLHLRYTARPSATARDVAEGLAARGFAYPASGAFTSPQEGQPVVISAARDQADAWFAARADEGSTMTFATGSAVLPSIGTLAVTAVIAVPIGGSSVLGCKIGGVDASSVTLGGLPAFVRSFAAGTTTAVVFFDNIMPDSGTPIELDTLDDIALILVLS
jgi:hypothetical protein